MVALRYFAGDEALDFCLAGIRKKLLAPELPVAAGRGVDLAKMRARRAAVAAVSGSIHETDSPHRVSGPMASWFGLLGALVGDKSGRPGDEAIRVRPRLLREAVDRGAASLVLTALEAAALVPGPAGVDYPIVRDGMRLLTDLIKGDKRCWREAVFEDAQPGSALAARSAGLGSGCHRRAVSRWACAALDHLSRGRRAEKR